jgi:hypothetical protein
MPTAEETKTNHHCGETDDKMLLKDCMVGKAQIRELREQNISGTEELAGYVSRAPTAPLWSAPIVQAAWPYWNF